MTVLLNIYTVPNTVVQRVKREKAGSSDPAFSNQSIVQGNL